MTEDELVRVEEELIYMFDHEWGALNPVETQSLENHIKLWLDIR